MSLLSNVGGLRWEHKLNAGDNSTEQFLTIDRPLRVLPRCEHLPPNLTMASTSQQKKGRDVALPTLDVFIQVLNIAKDACGIPPAQIALGFASTLLTMIRVDSNPLPQDKLLTRVYLGYDG